MIIRDEADVTRAVLAELQRADDPRFREVMTAVVSHLHALVREVKLTEAEFQQACAVVARLGQATSASHNEVVLCAGSLGVSALVCLLNNDTRGEGGTTANLLGPFWREGSPRLQNGDSIVRFASQKAFRRRRGSCFARRLAYVLLDARLGYSSFGDAGSTNNSMWYGRLLVLCPTQFPNLPIASSRGLALRFSCLEVVKLHSYEQTDALVYRQRWIPPRSPLECENSVLSIARSHGGHGRASNAGNDIIASS